MKNCDTDNPKNVYDEEERNEILKNFYNELIENQEDLPPEFSKILVEDFWELI